MLDIWDLTIPELSGNQQRHAYIYLPVGYDEEDTRYPVIYMFDGQNLFRDEDASFGESWRLEDFLDENRIPVIIAAIDGNPLGDCRLEEYSPFDNSGLHGRGRTLIHWLVRHFKPEIDKSFRTLPDRSNTLIAGSSMGGLMALFGVTAYNRVFSKGACLSPSLWVDPKRVHHMLRRSVIGEDTLIYMDYGGNEIGNHDENLSALTAVTQALLQRGVDLTLRIVPGGTHSEASWSARLPIVMQCLGF